MYILKVFMELVKKRFSIYKIYKKGMGKLYFTLRFILPILFSFTIIFLLDFFNLNTNDLKSFIKETNGLVGIILGFSIASFAVFISIINKNLEKKSRDTEYTYRQIGSSLFFFNVEISIFIYLIGICIINFNNIAIPINSVFTNTLNDLSYLLELFTSKGLKAFIFIFYIFLFMQLLLNLFFSSLYLNSSIQKKSSTKEE